MKYWIHVIIILLVGIFLGQFIPWWAVAAVAIVSSFLLKHKFGLSAMFGFFAGFLLWAGLTFYEDVENQHILSSRMGELFGGIDNSLLIVLAGLIGGIIASLGSMVGAAAHNIVADDSKKE